MAICPLVTDFFLSFELATPFATLFMIIYGQLLKMDSSFCRWHRKWLILDQGNNRAEKQLYLDGSFGILDVVQAIEIKCFSNEPWSGKQIFEYVCDFIIAVCAILLLLCVCYFFNSSAVTCSSQNSSFVYAPDTAAISFVEYSYFTCSLYNNKMQNLKQYQQWAMRRQATKGTFSSDISHVYLCNDDKLLNKHTWWWWCSSAVESIVNFWFQRSELVNTFCLVE